jgi:hypothetical protein
VRIRTVLRVLSTLVIVAGLVFAVIGMLDLHNYGPQTLVSAVAVILLAGILWMLTEISEQLAELPEDLATYHPPVSISEATAAAPLPPPRPRVQSVAAPRP